MIIANSARPWNYIAFTPGQTCSVWSRMKHVSLRSAHSGGSRPWAKGSPVVFCLPCRLFFLLQRFLPKIRGAGGGGGAPLGPSPRSATGSHPVVNYTNHNRNMFILSMPWNYTSQDSLDLSQIKHCKTFQPKAQESKGPKCSLCAIKPLNECNSKFKLLHNNYWDSRALIG